MVEKIFVVCTMLHNFMLSEMETQDSTHRVGHGGPIGSDGIWLQGPTVRSPAGRGLDSTLANQWVKRRHDLAEHLEYSKRCRKSTRCSA